MYKLKIFNILFLFILFAYKPAIAQNGSDEPCNAPMITLNASNNLCANVVAADINGETGAVFTRSTKASSGLGTLPAVNCNGFKTSGSNQTQDWWYKITVPASGYFTFGFSDNTPSTYFDWVMYTSSSTTCSGAVFTEISNSSQCNPTDGFTLDAPTEIGPLPAGKVVYIRMWEEAEYDQDIDDSYEICANAAMPPPTECSSPLTPANNVIVGTFPVTLNWSPVANAASYDVYLRDVTNAGSFENLGNVIGNSVGLEGGLEYSTTYEWYVVPKSEGGIGNNSCANKFTFITAAPPPASSCATATQISSLPFSFSVGVNQPSGGAGTDADYGCLYDFNDDVDAPNPEFRWIKTTSTGNIHWKIEGVPDNTTFFNDDNPYDIDYAIWGPFTNLSTTTPGCGSVGSVGFPCGTGLGTPLKCNYDVTNGGNISINNVLANRYYLVLITNWSDSSGIVNVTNTSGSTATLETPCLVNELAVTPNSDCNNNTYSVNYSVSFTTAPTTGTLNITDGEGHSVAINAPFTSPKTGTISGLTADGAYHTFTASFSANTGCKLCTNYTSPNPAPSNNTCASGLSLSANASAGAATGYTNMCTGKSVGEATYCGSPACKSVFYKIHTSSAAVDNSLNIDFDGGNSGDQLGSCVNGLRVTVLTDCNTLATVTPSSCQKVSTQTASLTFGGLALNTDYYIAVDQTNCSDESCNWSMKFLGIGVLPITMGSFEVIKMNTYNSLKWITVNEQKTDYFELLRSTDGITYYSIGKLTAADIRNGSSYSFSDDNMPAGINYYKIKTVNKDGTFELSEIRKINNSSATFNLAVMPNPAKNDIKVVINNVEKGEGKFIITDGIGRKLAMENVQLTTGKNEFKFDISKYSAGVLYIKFIDKNGVTATQPINKLR